MLTEYEVRRHMELIQASRVAPLRKARMLLRIGKSLTTQMNALHQANELIAQTADRKAAAGLNRMEHNIHQLNEDLRDAAFDALHPPPAREPYLF